MARLLLTSCLVLMPSAALAASLTGHVSNGTTGIAGAQVRLWAHTPKGYSLQATGSQVVAADVDGLFTFTGVPAGSYKVDARGPAQSTENWGDRWVDTAAPTANGYVADAADVFILEDTTDLTGVDLTLEVCGGADGTVLQQGNLTAGILVRAESRLDPRIHHNDLSQDTVHQGEYHLRGLPPGTYRVLAHDPNALQADVALAAPVDVASAVNVPDLALSLVDAPLDPHEPNNSLANAYAVDAGMFQQDPPLAFTTVGARIAPRNAGDVDWYCYDARAGDRFRIAARGALQLEDGTLRESPWVDPLISLWMTDGDGGMQPALQDDDNGAGLADALLDTGELAVGGPHCVAVTTFGDTTLDGTTQGSAGDYELRIAMGNRGPTFQPSLVTPDGGVALPVPPATLDILEGETVDIQLAFADADHDTLNATWDLVNALASPETAGSFDTSTGASTFSWTASQTAARNSPYTLTLRVADSEFTRTTNVVIHVGAVNVTPGLPTLLTPVDGTTLADHAALLVCSESYDPDLQTLTYQVEVYFNDGGVPARTGTAVGHLGGWDPDAGPAPTLQWQTNGIPENTRAHWRVRAFDGDGTNGYSPWTAFANFMVDVMNDPPTAPFLTKPASGEMVMLLRPTLSVTTPTDPEDDPVTVTFEVASDDQFAQVVATSAPLPTSASASMLWTVPQDLSWGGRYFARAHAEDSRGGISAHSNVNPFTIQPNQRPSTPVFLTPPPSMCGGGTVRVPVTQAVVGPSVDPEMEAVTVQLQVFVGDVDPETAAPAVDTLLPQGASSTTFDLATLTYQDQHAYRLRVRASDAMGPSLWADCRFFYDTGTSSSSAASGGSGSNGSSLHASSAGNGASSGNVIGGRDAGESAGSGDGAASSGCGCRAVQGPPGWVWLLMLGLLRRRTSP
jgi:MYXO-CTERM domain-containing protein